MTSQRKPTVAVVLGPFGSGTSALVAAVAALGANAHPPFAEVADPKTPVSGESLELRRIVVPAFDHENLCRQELPPWFIARLSLWAGPGLSVAKMPALAFFVPEILAAWDAKFIRLRRDHEAIEATRIRRDWPSEYGRAGAEKIEVELDRALANQTVLDVSFDDLRRDVEGVGARIAEFLSIPANADAVRQVVRQD
ncbi:MAG: sulfotransferase [Pseudomonadota bacterium]